MAEQEKATIRQVGLVMRQPAREHEREPPEAQPVGQMRRDPLAQVPCREGDAGCAGEHASILQRATDGKPTRARGSLLRLQREYGNRFVRRVLSLSRKGQGESDATPEVEEAILAARGGGQALDHGVRAQMEPALGADFGGVRVHTGGQADALNRGLSARAFTTGQDIFFKQGEYNPGSSSGRELLAHELTHVVQQNGDQVRRKLTIGAADDQYEQEADRVASSVMRQAPEEEEKKEPMQAKLDDGQVQRQVEEERKKEEEPLQMKLRDGSIQRQAEEEEKEEELVRAKQDSLVQRQGWEIAGVAIGAASFAVTALPAGPGGFSLTNAQLRYSRDQAGPHRIIERRYPILTISSIKGAGASYAFLDLVLRFDGHNIISAYTEADTISGYEGGVFGSEAQVTFSAVRASGPQEQVTQAYLLFNGFNNPSGPGFQRFSGRILVTGDGRVAPDSRASRLTDGSGYMRRWLYGFELAW